VVGFRFSVVLAVLTGCGGGGAAGGGDPGWAGLYQVTHHTENQGTCDTEGVARSDPPFFRLNRRGNEYRYDPCDSATDTTCDFGSIWFQGNGDRWTGEQPGTSQSGDLCTLSYYAWTLIHWPDRSVRIEIREYGGTGEPGKCTTDEARRRGTSLPCRRFEVIVGAAPGGPPRDAGPAAAPGDAAAADGDPGAPGSGFPCVMQPCGGDLTGRWQITASCYSKGQDLGTLACPKTAYDRKGVVTSGEISFDGGRYTMKLTHRGITNVTYSLSCSQALTCAQLEARLRPTDPTTPLTVSCRQSADLCLCTLEADGVHDDESGLYELDNLLLTTTPAGATAHNAYQYCAQGSVMKMAGPIVFGPSGEKVAAGIYTLSRAP
jgi:hypothetical protein